MKMSDLFKKRSELAVEFDDQTINIAFAPNRLDARVMMMVAGPMAPTVLVDVLSHLILDWDFTDDDGKKLPVTEDALAELPVALLMKIANAVVEEINGSKNAETSSDS